MERSEYKLKNIITYVRKNCITYLTSVVVINVVYESKAKTLVMDYVKTYINCNIKYIYQTNNTQEK